MISTTRDTLFRDALQDVNHKMTGLRRELAQKCNDLVKCDGKICTLNERIVDLKANLAQAGSTLEEKEKQLTESLKMETERGKVNGSQNKQIYAIVSYRFKDRPTVNRSRWLQTAF